MVMDARGLRLPGVFFAANLERSRLGLGLWLFSGGSLRY